MACYHRRGVRSLSGTLVLAHPYRAESPQRLLSVVSSSAFYIGVVSPIYQRTPCRRAMTPIGMIQTFRILSPCPSLPQGLPVHSYGCVAMGSSTLTAEAVVLVTPRTAIVEQTSNAYVAPAKTGFIFLSYFLFRMYSLSMSCFLHFSVFLSIFCSSFLRVYL